MDSTQSRLNIPVWPTIAMVVGAAVIWELAGALFVALVFALGGIAAIVVGGKGREYGLVALVLAMVALVVFLVALTL